MFNKYRQEQFKIYNQSRKALIANPEILTNLEKYFSDYILELLKDNVGEIKKDYDEASALYPFWQNYPPDDRGRQPRGDQYPWIEVGEHSVGVRIARKIGNDFEVRDTGLPSGPDQRFVLSSKKIASITHGLTDSAWLMLDIKSVGPRDDFDHTVMSHNQISGNGIWNSVGLGIKNDVTYARGVRTKHPFYPALSPIYILSDGTIAPTITIALKPVYKMLSEGDRKSDGGQTFSHLDLVSIPNGLLLLENPGYLKKNPRLFYPGKDDKGKNPYKVRCRISFPLLRKIDQWRVRNLVD